MLRLSEVLSTHIYTSRHQNSQTIWIQEKIKTEKLHLAALLPSGQYITVAENVILVTLFPYICDAVNPTTGKYTVVNGEVLQIFAGKSCTLFHKC